MDELYISREGLEKIKAELERLKTVERLEISQMIGEAKSYGDLSENSEYDAAKTKEAQLEARIIDLENQVKYAIIIDKEKINTKVVGVGCEITLYDETFEEDVSYKIVGETESDPFKGLISNQSPVGRALLGSRVGERVCVQTPEGESYYIVKKIKA